ncbi:hypothetical protein NPIL_631781 [Nephila pilipes]|uniref:Uncharacterized protein n=1 Tax=Nephila pilipes TaxID=299642 RepID=A0A8X6TUN1_NEPPI|nr:hypothetical protein NPIL_631781 [Nephila pilipes]
MSEPIGHPPLLFSLFQEMNPEFLKGEKTGKEELDFLKKRDASIPKPLLGKARGVFWSRDGEQTSSLLWKRPQGSKGIFQSSTYNSRKISNDRKESHHC